MTLFNITISPFVLIPGLLIIGFLFITSLYASIIAAPFVATPKNYIRIALRKCNLKSGEKIYDLGSGDGRILIMAAKEFGAQAEGFELSFWLYLISRIKILYHRLSNQARVRWRNFYNEDLGRADIVFCWLTPKAFQKLIPKFNRELKNGARIVTYSSQLVPWQSKQEIELPSPGLKFFGIHLIKPSKVKLYFYSKN